MDMSTAVDKQRVGEQTYSRVAQSIDVVLYMPQSRNQFSPKNVPPAAVMSLCPSFDWPEDQGVGLVVVVFVGACCG
jgi:hypothetical protein